MRSAERDEGRVDDDGGHVDGGSRYKSCAVKRTVAVWKIFGGGQLGKRRSNVC